MQMEPSNLPKRILAELCDQEELIHKMTETIQRLEKEIEEQKAIIRAMADISNVELSTTVVSQRNKIRELQQRLEKSRAAPL